MTTMNFDLAYDVVHLALLAIGVILPVAATGHAVLNKRDSPAAIAWVGFIWLVPLVGSIMYFVFGINRIRRKAALLRSNLERYRAQAVQPECLPEELQAHLAAGASHLEMLAQVVGKVVERPLLHGNRIEPLINGDEAYPAMLEAIGRARHTVSLVSYIFDRDEIGLAFVDELGKAVSRGVEVRVLIDATGARYSWPPIIRALRRAGVTCARFLPTFPSWHLMSINMRTHRKIMVVDGWEGFTGGMNIRVGHCLARQPSSPVQDIQFRITGPVVNQFQEVFTDDWLFTTGEALRGDKWFPDLDNAGQVLARGVTDGPDENFEKLLWTLLGALSIARRSVKIMTPYFLPDPSVVSAINLAAMRGVEIDIILPEKNNLPFVMWASRAMWEQLLHHGCRIWLTPPPFDHSKLMLVDESWLLLGSANWDPRSLRLNFEFNVECYDRALARQIDEMIETKRGRARSVVLADVENRTLPGRLRDGIARLLTPYL